MKKTLTIILLLVSLLGLTGCGSTSMMDEYIFGSRVFTQGQSTIEVALPFDLAEGNPKDVVMKGMTPNRVYVNMDKHFIMQVAVQENPTITAETFTKDQLESFKLNPQLTGVEGSIQDVTSNGISMQHLVVRYKAQQIPLYLVQYNFVDQGVLWSITYRTTQTDSMGLDVMKYIGGKIQRVQ